MAQLQTHRARFSSSALTTSMLLSEVLPDPASVRRSRPKVLDRCCGPRTSSWATCWRTAASQPPMREERQAFRESLLP